MATVYRDDDCCLFILVPAAIIILVMNYIKQSIVMGKLPSGEE